MFFEKLRKHIVPLVCLKVLLFLFSMYDISFAADFSPAMIRRASSAVKLLVTDKGQGTAFFISSEGHMLTNFHVVEGTRKAAILEGGNAYDVTRIIALNKEADVALLETRYPRSKIHHLPLRQSLIEMGEEIMVLGYPVAAQLGTEITFTKGNVSSIRPAGVNTRVQFTAATRRTRLLKINSSRRT